MQQATAQHRRADAARIPPSCLIVEDSEFDRIKLSRVLAKSHHKMRVQTATTLNAARAALEKGNTALILLDNNLPDGFGADFALELARDKRLANIPVIMVSDWPSPFMWEKAARAGVTYVLSKSEFDQRYIHAALERRQGKQRRVN